MSPSSNVDTPAHAARIRLKQAPESGIACVSALPWQRGSMQTPNASAYKKYPEGRDQGSWSVTSDGDKRKRGTKEKKKIKEKEERKTKEKRSSNGELSVEWKRWQSYTQYDQHPIYQTSQQYTRRFLLDFQLENRHRYFEIDQDEQLDIRVPMVNGDGGPGDKVGIARIPATYGPHLWRYQAEIYYLRQFRKDKLYFVHWLVKVLDAFAEELISMIGNASNGVGVPSVKNWISPALWPLACRALYGLSDDDIQGIHQCILFLADIRMDHSNRTGADNSSVTGADIYAFYHRNPFQHKYLNGMHIC